MHRSERNLDVRVGITPTIHPIYRRNNLENNLQNNGINFSKQPVVFEKQTHYCYYKSKSKSYSKDNSESDHERKSFFLSGGQAAQRETLSFLGQNDSCQETGICTGGSAIPWVHPLSCAPGVYAHLGTSRNPGLRADAIRPYGSSGEAGSIHPTTLLTYKPLRFR